MRFVAFLLVIVYTLSVIHAELVCGDKTYVDIVSFGNKSVLQNSVKRTKQCLRKCCPLGEGYTSKIRRNCTISYEEFEVDIFSQKLEKLDMNVEETFSIIVNDYCKNNGFILNPLEDNDDAFYLLDNGTIMLPNSDIPVFYSWKNYCLEKLFDRNVSVVVAVICFPDQTQNKSSFYIYIMYGIGMLISTSLLLITLIIYGLNAELRNLHGKVLMGYISGLIVAYVALVTSQSTVFMKNEIEDPWCTILAFIVYFFFMVSFFWLNVMCIDIWLAFRIMENPTVRKTAENRRFLLYSIYAWGVPSLLTGICALIEFYPNIGNKVIKPEFGKQKCWFLTKKATFLYFYQVMFALDVINIVLFVLTAYKILSIKKETLIIRGNDSKRHSQFDKERQRYNLYLRLFLVMGITWVAECLSFLIGGGNYLWILTDLCNSIQGIFIFIVFVCKKKVKKLLTKKLHSTTALKSRNSSRFQSCNTTSTGITNSKYEEPLTEI